jgi:hypothetical protein
VTSGGVDQGGKLPLQKCVLTVTAGQWNRAFVTVELKRSNSFNPVCLARRLLAQNRQHLAVMSVRIDDMLMKGCSFWFR